MPDKMGNRRFYERFQYKIPLPILIYVQDLGNVELNGVIKNISEEGIGIELKNDDFNKQIIKKINVGDKLLFQFIDTTKGLWNTAQFLQGKLEIKHINKNTYEIGCKVIRNSNGYIEYVSSKKANEYMSYFKRTP